MKIGYLMQEGVPDIRQQPPSGPAVHIRRVCEALQELGHVVIVLAVLDGRIWYTEDLEQFRPVECIWLDRGPIRWFERFIRRIQYELQLPYAALFESLRFAQACRQELGDCDLFYERMGWMANGGSLAARWMSTPLILEVNGDHLSEFEKLGIAPHGAQRRLSMWLTRQASHRAFHIVATGEGWRQKFIESWKVDPDLVTVVENGTEMVDRLKREDLRSFLPFAKADLTAAIIYVGAIEPWHGVDVLVDAFAQAIKQGISARLHVVGAGTKMEEVRKQVREQNIEQFVTFTGHVSADHVAKYLAQADIGVAPYCGRVEFSGLKLLDYKAAGLTTVASGRDGQPAVLQHGQTGLIVPPCKVEPMAEALVLLCLDAELRRRIGQAARIEAENYHSWRQTAQHLERIFKQVVRA